MLASQALIPYRIGVVILTILSPESTGSQKENEDVPCRFSEGQCCLAPLLHVMEKSAVVSPSFFVRTF